MLVHILGAKCSPCCASYALKKCAEDADPTRISSDTISTILNEFYMDDLIKSVDEENQGTSLVTELREVTKAKGFRLTKFNSTSSEVLECLPSSERAPTKTEFNPDEQDLKRALGVKWKMKEDVFTFESN